MPAEHEQQSASGLSRRQLLTRGAIAGGLVWAAPVIRSTAAYATTVNGTERPCTNFFMVVINPAGKAHPAPGNTQASSVPPKIRQWFRDNPDVPVEFPAVPPLLTQTGQDAWAVLLPEVTGPNAAGRQCRMVLGWARKGRSFKEGYIDPNPAIAVDVGRRLIFPCPPREDNANSPSGTGQISSDGDASGGITSDGAPSRTVTSDGSPSVDQQTGPGRCIDAVYLIYCCPR